MQRAFVWAPPLLTLLYCAIAALTDGSAAGVYGGVAVAKLLAAIGLGLAAARYTRRDYLFWAFALLGGNYALLFIAEVGFSRRMHLIPLPEALSSLLGTALVVLGNLMAAVAAVMLARVWRVVGVALPNPTPAKRVFVIVGIALAVALVGWSTIPSLKVLVQGRGDGVIGVVGSACDLVGFCVITPLALRALALRGGTLAWPWGLFAASWATWMVFDFVVDLDLPLSDNAARAMVNGLRVVACILAFGAGLAQRWAVRAET
jgi:hypothetical protein